MDYAVSRADRAACARLRRGQP